MVSGQTAMYSVAQIRAGLQQVYLDDTFQYRRPYDQMQLLAHEITHSVQYRDLGKANFLERYAVGHGQPDNYDVPPELWAIPTDQLSVTQAGSYLGQDGFRHDFTLDQIAERIGTENSIGGASMKWINWVAVCTVLCTIGCEPKLALDLERLGAAYEFVLHREDDKRAFGAESFDVMEGQSVVCEVRHTPGPGTRVSRWIYGSSPSGYSLSPHCEPLQTGRTYRATGGGRFFGMLFFRLKADGDVEILHRGVPD